ncbi:MAG: ferrous iron transport protein B [Clostridia bacterium]|nr:ferrous iron transport protein B [Clostridia bacterium]
MIMKFALAGNPNSGKTTLFNALTGSTAHVGNWPGVTVDKKDGYYKKLSEKVQIVDLPGIYSLSPYTPEEVISRNYILEEMPDAIINIVDATNLERNLYLTTQLLEIDVPVIVALNMMDALERNGDSIDIERLEKKIGVPVVLISALKGKGIKELMERAYAAASVARKGYSVLQNSKIKDMYAEILSLYNESDNAVFHTVKMLEADELEIAANPSIAERAAIIKSTIDNEEYDNDYEGIVADARYKYITEHYSKALKRSKSHTGDSRSDKIDKVLTHRFWGIPIFLLIMLAVFHFTFSENLLMLAYLIPEGSFDILIIGTDAINSPGVMLFNLIDLGTSSLGEAVAAALSSSPEWVSSLVVDGLLGGLFAVLSFIPQIMVLFFFLSLLEDSGYMARVAFIMDRAFRRFGLSGKAFLPLLMCFGCAVPGIMATRTLENEKERRMAIMLTPFMSCGAKMPIWATFAGIMFAGAFAEVIVFGVYLLGIVVAILSAMLLKKTALRGETPPFIMELPTYHLPQLKNTGIHLWEKLKHYVIRAATVIAGAVVIIWALSTFSFGFRMVEPSDSMLGQIGRVLSWLFVPIGFGQGGSGWQFVVAAITGLIAKEMVVATMGVFSGMDGDAVLDAGAEDLQGSNLANMINGISAPAAFSFMAFNLLSIPCMAAVAAAKGELKSAKKLMAALGFWMGAAYLVSALIYWIGTYWWISLILVGLIGLMIGISKIVKYNKLKLAKIKANI